MSNKINEEISESDKSKVIPRKRIGIVSIKMIREKNVLFDIRVINSPKDSEKLGRIFLENADREEFMICCLDNKNKPTLINIVSIGSINKSIVHPREVFKAAILSNAASIMLFHNHPSGDIEPSNEDINITGRLKKCGDIIGINVIDHIIIGDREYYSFKEKGLL
ncbi:MAG: DNA repair protein RadC [Clostridium tyrobutyricum]|jgi:DNA repair protein RadC|uniref:RadC family protein n=1 Tax=Clostridium tyrobutyricum TaxID=1519 RepID=UPI00242E13E0|nr:DNA repair protein RadC [Clostridium tyrobutyricum]MCH4198728.1 DNA repair protein RadC [Clostridium tyrobutyricum]MCH4260003.1 DNA repair protein RadC [Clostridium tyrobutyricum]MCI1239657.1 DNA repair protein RadC [Clostridium tyrobutyricum]MCI1652388.1 DNA repair protein RadC [Clostridium tyrobutyricum]MCI1938097.1 DNA repair protein RadC [Clostridium tyrobutyricum]